MPEPWDDLVVGLATLPVQHLPVGPWHHLVRAALLNTTQCHPDPAGGTAVADESHCSRSSRHRRCGVGALRRAGDAVRDHRQLKREIPCHLCGSMAVVGHRSVEPLQFLREGRGRRSTRKPTASPAPNSAKKSKRAAAKVHRKRSRRRQPLLHEKGPSEQPAQPKPGSLAPRPTSVRWRIGCAKER